MPLVYLKELITAYDLLKRWEREVSEGRLASLMKRKTLQAYRLPSPPVPRKPGDKYDAYEPWEGEPNRAIMHLFWDIPEDRTVYDFSGFVFNMADIVAYEVKHLGHNEPPAVMGIQNQTTATPTTKAPKKHKRGHITQKEAAKLCGISERKFQDLESGKKESPLDWSMPSRYELKEFSKWAEAYIRWNNVLDAVKDKRLVKDKYAEEKILHKRYAGGGDDDE